MTAPFTYGYSACGAPLMKFTLTYDGPLSGSGNSSRKTTEKWSIRRHLEPQLKQLWGTHPALLQTKESGVVPIDREFTMSQRHHLHEERVETKNVHNYPHTLDLCESIARGGIQFRPVVRNSLALVCSLNVLFMRQEAIGRVYQGGDLDNRIKTLLDALAVPDNEEQTRKAKTELGIGDDELIFCLLEDDALITGLNVETRRLLTRPGAKENEVRLVIDVDVRVTDSRLYNLAFLGE
jgi:hypothetical protein